MTFADILILFLVGVVVFLPLKILLEMPRQARVEAVAMLTTAL